MSAPSSSTVPVTEAPGTVMCSPLMQRSTVDLPQPDGPMSAVTLPGSMVMLTSVTAGRPR